MIGATPQGYTRLTLPQGDGVIHQRMADAVRDAAGSGTLYDWAAAHPDRRELRGRRPAYAVPLGATGQRVVVRRSAHGGALAPLLGEYFVAPTRAPRELLTSLLLSHAGVPTPPLVGYLRYRAAPLVRRVDVVSILLPGEDLGEALSRARAPHERAALVPPVAVLLGALTEAGAWHPDLNVKNILLVPDDAGALHPAVLDVDRVTFVSPADPNLRDANYRRLVRSNAKWRRTRGAGFDDAELEEIRTRLLRDEAVVAAHRALAIEEYMP